MTNKSIFSSTYFWLALGVAGAALYLYSVKKTTTNTQIGTNTNSGATPGGNGYIAPDTNSGTNNMNNTDNSVVTYAEKKTMPAPTTTSTMATAQTMPGDSYNTGTSVSGNQYVQRFDEAV